MSVRANRRWEPHEVLRTALTVCDKRGGVGRNVRYTGYVDTVTAINAYPGEEQS